MSVLLAEDNPADAGLVRLGLAFVDLNLPEKPEREVLARMRISERYRHIPVVILSSSDAERDKADAVRREPVYSQAVEAE